jgi:hypothetical protein
MKKLRQFISPLRMALPLLVIAAPSSAVVRAGFATADLTPQLGLEMGGFGMNLGRTGDAVHDKLLARAVVIESSGSKIAVVGCDLGGIRAAVVAEARKLIQKATGIERERIMIGATHTHSAPVVARWIGVGKENPEYISALPARIASSVITANSRINPVTLLYGEAPVDGVARNREYPNGILDPAVRVLSFKRPSGELAGFIANYSVHPVVMAEKTRMYTGDLTGVATDKAAAQSSGSVGIFLQGSCGDINPIYAHMAQEESLEKLELLAGRLASAIRAAIDSAQSVADGTVEMRSQRIGLPLVPPPKDLVFERMSSAEGWLKNPELPGDLRRDAQFRLDSAKAVLERYDHEPLTERITEVQAARIGNTLILANPGETFQIFGRHAAEAMRGYRVMVTGYTNDYIGYIPARDRYDFQKLNALSYPAYFTPWICGDFRYREDVGDVLVDEMVRLGQEIASRTP